MAHSFKLIVLTFISTATIISANSTSLYDLNKILTDTQDSLAEVKSGNLKLKSELNSVNLEIEKKEEAFKTLQEGAKKKTGALLETLELLVFETNKLKIDLDFKNESQQFMEELIGRVSLSLELAKDEVRVLKERRTKGLEDSCFELDKAFKKSVALITPKNNTGNKLSLRSTYSDDQTATIALLIAKIDVAKSELISAQLESTRLVNLLWQKKGLLKKDQASWNPEADRITNTLKSTQEKVEELQKIVINYKKLNIAATNTIKGLAKKLEAHKKEWMEQQRLLKTTFKNARACYQGSEKRAHTAFSEYANFQRVITGRL